MDVNDDAGCLIERGVLTFFASKLAPTGSQDHPMNMTESTLRRAVPMEAR
ncbi:hypothetical protein [Pseudomonas sp. SDO5591_S426]